MDAQMKRGFLEVCVLASINRQDSYGYQIVVMNGYEATAAIRSLAGSRGKVPIIAMTANAFAEDVQLAKNTGMNEHIAKPLDLNKLNDVLKQWL